MAVPRLLARLPLPLLEICIFQRNFETKIGDRYSRRFSSDEISTRVSNFFFFFFFPRFEKERISRSESWSTAISESDDHFSMKRAASGNCCTNSWTKIQQRTGGGWPGLRGFRTRFLFFLFYPNKTLLPYLSPSFCVSWLLPDRTVFSTVNARRARSRPPYSFTV